MDDQIIQHRMARGIIVEGASGILASEWTDVLERLTTVEGVAETFLPYTPDTGQYISPVTHGIGDKNQETVGIVQPNNVYWTPIWVPQAITTNSMAVHVTDPAAGGTLTLGLYDRNGSLVRSYGTVTTDTGGWKIAALSTGVTQEVPPGLSWLAVKANTTSDIEIVMYQCDRFLFQDSGFVGRATPLLSVAGGLPSSVSPANWMSVVPHMLLGVTT